MFKKEMAGVGDRGIQVLNISNVNALGKTVLNDGKLLDLIQKYPFLYNSRIRGYNDDDYVNWAWKNINAAFNQSYSNDPNAAFSTQELSKRWMDLKPLIQCLSKAYDLDAIPKALRKSVIKISRELEDKSCNSIVKPNSYQNLLLENMQSIRQLPMEKKLALERDILDVILSSELDSVHAKKINSSVWREIEHETDEFLNEIGFKRVLATVAGQQKMMVYNHSNKKSIKKFMKNNKTLGWIPLTETRHFIKPCFVRLRRINIEDYLPLAKIIQMERESNKVECKTESPGIFGI